MVLLILAVIWAAVLLPPFLRYRFEGHPVDSVGRFRRHLRVLESTTPAASALAHNPVMAGAGNMPYAWAVEARRLRLIRRRQQVAFILLGAMASTLVIGLVPGLHFVLALHVIADIAFAAYVTMLVKARNEQRARRIAAVAAERQAEVEYETPALATQAL